MTNQSLTAREMKQAIDNVRPEVNRYVSDYLTAANRYVGAKHDYDKAEAQAFIEAKEAGASDELAKRKALLATADLRVTMEDLLEQKRAYKLGADTTGEVLKAYAASSYALNSEIKAFVA